MRSAVVVIAVLVSSSYGLAQAPVLADEQATIAVLPLRVEALQLNEVQRINVQMRLRAGTRGGFQVQSEADTTALVEATQSLGLDCDVNAVECGVRVGQIADVGFVLLGKAVGDLDGHVGIDVTIVDVKKGEVVRRVSALLPTDMTKQADAMNAFADTLFAKPGTPQALLVSLELLVQPAGADVLVDGVPRGAAPIAPIATLAPGDHYVIVSKKGFITYRSRIAVLTGEAARLEVTLAVDPNAMRTAPTGLEAAAPWIVTGVGAVALVGGGIAAAISGARYLEFQDAVAAVNSVDIAGDAELTAAEVDTIATSHAIAERAAGDWSSWGQATFVGGVVSASIGLLVAAGGVTWGIVQANDVGESGPEDPAAAPTAP